MGLFSPVAAQRLVLAAAAGRARHLPLPKPSLARGAYPQRRSRCPLQTVLGAYPCWSKTPMPASALFSTGKVRMILPHAMIFYSTTPGKAQPPEHLLTFTPLRRQGHDQASRLRLQHSPPQSQGHAQERTSCADQPPLPAQPFSPACTTPGEPAFGSALRQRAGAGGDGQARHPDRNVHRPKVTCAGDIPRQATPIHQPHCHLFSKFILSAPNGTRISRTRSERSEEQVGFMPTVGRVS